jgi:4-diphosphocytidyl-2-C-methyl-D-erythritol kinase
LEDNVLREIAAELGSDMPVCLASRPAFMEGRGEILTLLGMLPGLPLLLVNPGAAVSTKDVFALLGERRGVGMKLPKAGFSDLADLLRFLETTGNDLELPARTLQPVIDEVLGDLKGLPGALFTRMSGSGATCFALMSDDDGCARAASLLKARRPGWWVQPARVAAIGSAHDGRGRDIGPSEGGL